MRVTLSAGFSPSELRALVQFIDRLGSGGCIIVLQRDEVSAELAAELAASVDAARIRVTFQ